MMRMNASIMGPALGIERAFPSAKVANVRRCLLERVRLIEHEHLGSYSAAGGLAMKCFLGIVGYSILGLLAGAGIIELAAAHGLAAIWVIILGIAGGFMTGLTHCLDDHDNRAISDSTAGWHQQPSSNFGLRGSRHCVRGRNSSLLPRPQNRFSFLFMDYRTGGTICGGKLGALSACCSH